MKGRLRRGSLPSVAWRSAYLVAMWSLCTALATLGVSVAAAAQPEDLHPSREGGTTSTTKEKPVTMTSIPDLLRDFAQQMQPAGATPSSLTGAIGVPVASSEASGHMDVSPRDAAFKAVQVMSDGQGILNHVVFQLADPMDLPVQALVDSFGAYREVPRVSFSQPPRVAFAPLVDPEQGFAVTLFAQIRPGAGGLVDGHVLVVTLRRDARSTGSAPN